MIVIIITILDAIAKSSISAAALEAAQDSSKGKQSP